MNTVLFSSFSSTFFCLLILFSFSNKLPHKKKTRVFFKRLYTVTWQPERGILPQLLKFNQSLKIEEAYVLRRLPVSFHFNSFCPVKDCTR